MNDIRKIINLVESLSKPLYEAKHHDMFKEAVGALTRVIAENGIDEEKLNKDIEFAKGFVKRADESVIPKKWLKFVTEAAIANVYLAALLYAKTPTKKLESTVTKKASKHKEYEYLKASSISDLNSFLNNLLHYAGINYAPIQDANPDDHTENGFLRALSKLENDFIEKSKESIPVGKQGEYTRVIDFPDGLTWVLLDRSHCSIEGDAMGHCGNTGSPSKGDRILSLRKIEDTPKGEQHRPSLTFIINKGMLGEMKGRANNKPNKKYHPYIVELLKHDMVKGVRGGGYKPENNFNLMDLDTSDLEEVAPYLKLPKDFVKVAEAVKNPESTKNAILVKIVEKAMDGKLDKYPDIDTMLIHTCNIVDMTPSKDIDENALFRYGSQHNIKNKNFYAPLVNVAAYAATISTEILKERWPEVEDAIMKSDGCIDYAEKFFPEGWPELVTFMVENRRADSAISYAKHIIKGRWPIAEKLVLSSKNPFLASKYFNRVLKTGERWKEGESLFAKSTSSRLMVDYALNSIKGRFQEAEPVIARGEEEGMFAYLTMTRQSWPELVERCAKAPNTAYKYAKLLGKPFPEGEDVILTDATVTRYYIDNVIKGEWPNAVKTIMMRDPEKMTEHDQMENIVLIYEYFTKWITEPNKDFEKVLLNLNNSPLIEQYNKKFGTSL